MKIEWPGSPSDVMIKVTTISDVTPRKGWQDNACLTRNKVKHANTEDFGSYVLKLDSPANRCRIVWTRQGVIVNKGGCAFLML